jgi:hypothetical protein
LAAECLFSGVESGKHLPPQIAHDLRVSIRKNIRINVQCNKHFFPHPVDLSNLRRLSRWMSVPGTFETCRPTPTMSVPRGNSEVAFRGRQDRL